MVHPQKESDMNGKRSRRVGTVVVMTAMLAVLAVPTSLPAAAVDVPDQVLAWNQNAYTELIGLTPPPLNAPVVAIHHLAMVHGAIYDAVNAIDGGYEPYLGAPAMADSGDSEDAAAAAAAYQVLLDILQPPVIAEADVPTVAARLQGYYNDSLAAIANAGVSQSSINGGVAVGNAAAAAMIAERDGDGRYGNPSFSVGFEDGEWRPVVDGLAGNNYRWVGDMDPFFIPSAARFATRGPLDITSDEYAREYARVKTLGRATGSTRTPNQTNMALFWADHAVAMWTRIFRQLSGGQDLSTAENARFFGMLYLTGADALIACWADKEATHFWRPQTAIQEVDDGNPATVPDTAWLPLVPTPPYPDHPSGHNCVSGSFVRTLQQFFGTNDMSFSATRAFPQPGPAPITRSFTRFGQAISEIRRARVFAGLHFWTADAQGARLGRRVANWRQEHLFQPVA
jgi:PAP2 superfamily